MQPVVDADQLQKALTYLNDPNSEKTPDELSAISENNNIGTQIAHLDSQINGILERVEGLRVQRHKLQGIREYIMERAAFKRASAVVAASEAEAKPAPVADSQHTAEPAK
jgi:hypothetical protein